jgi:hypothetical protein
MTTGGQGSGSHGTIEASPLLFYLQNPLDLFYSQRAQRALKFLFRLKILLFSNLYSKEGM